jgi:hypothetical protein
MPSVLEVRRTDTTATYLRDSAPSAYDRYRAERNDPPLRRGAGHSWPGIDDSKASGAYALLLENQDHP